MGKHHPTPEKRRKEKCEVYYRGLSRNLDQFQKDWRDGNEIKRETYERLQEIYFRISEDNFKKCFSRKTLERDIKLLRKKNNIPSPAKAPKNPNREKKNRPVRIQDNFFEKLERVDIIDLRRLLVSVTECVLKNEHGGLEEYHSIYTERIEPLINEFTKPSASIVENTDTTDLTSPITEPIQEMQ